MDTAQTDFLNEVDGFLERTGMSATTFGRAAVSDPRFVPDIRAGRAPNLRLVQRVRDFIRDHDAPPTSPSQGEGDAASERESAAS